MNTILIAIRRLTNFVLCVFLIQSCQQDGPSTSNFKSELPQQVDFNYHIKPLLSDRCFKCHGPDSGARKGELRLDLPEQALKKELSDGGFAFVARKLRKSKAFQRLITTDPSLKMPPPESNLHLTDYEIALIGKWIKQGAEYKSHWSFIPPKKNELPSVKNKDWVKNEIDYFILNKMELEGLSPAQGANKHQLIRRLSFDLTGLPPSVEEVKNFVEDIRSEAYELLVDKLLASPQFGERMAIDWLDVARYADSHGYQDDGMRNTWPYRDWVIEAFNKNLSYDKFISWQLAGDLLPNPTDEQLLATCFNRNHPQTQEGGVVDEEYRSEYVADRTNTFGQAFLGLTTECARCHDHKYDPISQKDYYSLYAFFNQNNDSGIVPYNGEASPTLMLIPDSVESQLEELRQQIDPLEQAIKPENYVSEFKEWYKNSPLKSIGLPTKNDLLAQFDFEKEHEINANAIYLDKGPAPPRKKSKQLTYAYYNSIKQKLDANNWGHVDERPLVVEGYIGNGVQFVGDGGLRFNRDLDFDRNQPFTVSLWVKLLKPGEAGPIFNNTNGDFEGYRGWICKLNKDGTLSIQFNHVWPDNCIDIQTKEQLEVGRWTHLLLTYAGNSKADGIQFYMNGQPASRKIHKDHLQKSLLHGVKGTNWSNLPFLLGIELRQSIQNIVMDELSVYARQLSKLEVEVLYRGDVAQHDLQKRSEAEWLDLYLLGGYNGKFQEKQKQLIELRGKENLLLTDQPEIMIMQERKESRPTFVLDRGAYDAPLDTVYPNTPDEVLPYSKDFPANRLGLAKWLTADNHPLTSRVMVNRLWHMCFGKGLVGTQEDFGNQGNLPTHPELLDWLSVHFRESGWDIKAMLKMIVQSAAYQQASIASEMAKEQDSENLWYSHYPEHRLSAELIRDNALASSGLLVSKIGGPSVYPYQPEGIWEALATRNETRYVQQHGDSLYRRSLYTVWKRSSPPPPMTTFDAPDRYYCVVRRQKTSTPLQSLILMNDPQFVEAARMVGERMLKEGGQNPKDQISFGFLALTSRNPKPNELKLLSELYQEELTDFQSNPQRVKDWLSAGEYPVDQQLDQSALAACAVIASTIMNFEEFGVKK